MLDLDLDTAKGFATAILVGGLLGIEREQRNAREGAGVAGLRSFVLLAVVGAIGGHLAMSLAMPWVLPTAVLAALTIVASSFVHALRTNEAAFDVPTALAAVVATLVGALATAGSPVLAAGLGVLTTALLAYKRPLHGLAGRLHQDEVLIGLRFLLATFLVLPLLPDRTVDPWDAINPFELWLLVLLISGLSLLGYVLTRWLGPGRGIALTAATGGIVSSTAVTLTFVKQSRDDAGGAQSRQLAGGILLAWSVMFVRALVTAVLLERALLVPLLVPFGAMALASAAAAAVCFWHHHRRGDGEGARLQLRNPFSLLAATKFALFFAAVLLVLQLVQRHLPASGVYVVAAVAGLTDVDAITLSMARRAGDSPESLQLAVHAIAIAAVSNTLTKGGIGLALGHRALRVPLLLGTAAILGAGTIALLV